jgi:hypothetical protein
MEEEHTCRHEERESREVMQQMVLQAIAGALTFFTQHNNNN